MTVEKEKVELESATIRFSKIVLGWDYYRIKKECLRKKSKSKLKAVKNTYTDCDDYLSTFEPLLFEEVKAQISQQKDEDKESGMWLVMKWSESDEFYFPEVAPKDEGQHKLKGSKIVQNDLLLLSEDKEAKTKLDAFFEKEMPKGKELDTYIKQLKPYAFALVEQRVRDGLRLKMYLDGEIVDVNKSVLKSCERLENIQKLITASRVQTKKILYSWKICSLSTIAREYVALRSVVSLPCKNLILSPTENISGSEDEAWKVPEPLHKHIKEYHDESQKKAIRAGLSRKAFVLIQGPPGTGKTQTILGLLSAILHATPAALLSKGAIREVVRGPELPMNEKYNHWSHASPWLFGSNPRDEIMPIDGDDGFYPSTGNELKSEVVNSSRKYRVRVLICAPSNSALDEIVLRLLQTGIHDENIRSYTPKIVRIGLNPHPSVESVFMDTLVNQKQGESGTDKQKHGSNEDRDTIRAAIADEAVIVCSTLSFSGSSIFTKLKRGFDVVIIDEAAQAVETATLVPLANGCKQVFLVGDPVQLPATVISPVATELGYGTSLFQRFQSAGYEIHMLETQYRMHPEIRSFPSKEFYDDKLKDGADVLQRTKRDWHKYHCFGPFCFFDLQESKESKPSVGSLENVDEVDFVLLMYLKLVTKFPELSSNSQLAIISPYRRQVELLEDRFEKTIGDKYKQVVDINTVDGFQGREKVVVIFSCVRANEKKSIGFVSDFRRMNVGITRAKSSVLVVGSASTLRNDEHWNNLIESAEKRNTLFKVAKPYASFFEDKNLESMNLNKEKETLGVEMDMDTAIGNVPEHENEVVDVEMEDGGYNDDEGGDAED
ncbi:hypothetical protein ACFE04_022652 [Oxalis oulophora]